MNTGWPANRQKRRILYTLLLSVGLCQVSATQAAEAKAESCARTDLSRLQSPDSRWIASVYGESCDLGLATSMAVVVDLSRSGMTAPPVKVLGITMPASKALWPRPKWESATTLGIQLPANADIGLRMAQYQDIDISIHFCPSDPRARQRWLDYKEAYHKWLADFAAWVRSNRQQPGAAAGARPPSAPKAPVAGERDLTCGL